MRSITSIGLIALAVLATVVPSCSRQNSTGQDGKTTKILCSTFPMYLFTKAVTNGSQSVQVDMMLPAGAGCPHDYALTPQDMQKIAGAGIFVANGLGLEEFLGESLNKTNDKLIVIDTSAGIGDLIQLGHDEHHHAGPNPHLFASPRMAAKIVRNIAAELSKVHPADADLFRKNADAYATRLEKLADDFAAALKDVPVRKIVTEHAVFDYLARDCSLSIAAVVEENPGQEPSASEMLDIIKTIKSSGAAAVFTEPQYPAKVAQTIAGEVGIPVAVLDPVASGPDDSSPDYYEKTMRANLATLVATLRAK